MPSAQGCQTYFWRSQKTGSPNSQHKYLNPRTAKTKNWNQNKQSPHQITTKNQNTQCLGSLGCFPVITGLTASCGSLPLPSIARKYWTEYFWPRKKSTFRIQSAISPECILLLHHHKIKKIVSEIILHWKSFALGEGRTENLRENLLKRLQKGIV